MKKTFKWLALALAIAMVFAFAACNTNTVVEETTAATADEDATVEDATNAIVDAIERTAIAKEDLKLGFIFLHDENSTYDKNFMTAAKAVQEKYGLTDEQVLFKSNIPEGEECYNTAAEFAEAGCQMIFADSFGHESYMVQAAKDFPEVEFCHATGTNALTSGLSNYHNAFASIYEGRFLAGVAAGMKLNEMIENGEITAEEAKIGYVGAYPYAEVKSGYTSFFLGARYICESATMEVKYTNSWFDIAAEKEAALALIADDCVLISQHADSEGAPKACEENNIPNVAYNISTIDIAPTTALISSKIDWTPYFEHVIDALLNGTAIDTDWCGSLSTGSVQLTELNTACAAEGTQEKIDEIKAQLMDGSLKVFDTARFTVDGVALDTYLADVIPDDAYTPDTEAIKDGCFAESSDRSAPYFDILIDGITEM